jgi:hypothetical protein
MNNRTGLERNACQVLREYRKDSSDAAVLPVQAGRAVRDWQRSLILAMRGQLATICGL